MDGPVPPNAETTEALRALRERYRATSANAVAALRRLAAQLVTNPEAAELLETLRRELHRIHGSAGTYGFPRLSQVAAYFEEHAVRWMTDPTADRDLRSRMTSDFADMIERLLGTSAVEATGAAQENAAAASPPVSAPMPEPPSEVPDVILVEDDMSLVEMLRYALETGGFSCRHYGSGPEALEALLALDPGDRRPVLLLDLDLPGLDGFSLHERIRVERPGRYATVFFTARAGEADQLRAYRAGAIDYLAKPVNLRILIAKLPTWLRRARGPAGA